MSHACHSLLYLIHLLILFITLKSGSHIPKELILSALMRRFKKDRNNVFYFTLKAFFVLKRFNFFPDFFCQVGKSLDMKAGVNFKIYHITIYETNNYNTHIVQYLKK